MEDLNKLFQLSETLPRRLEQTSEDYLLKLRVILWGQAAVSATNLEKLTELVQASPQQTKKRPKRLSDLNEDKEQEVEWESLTKSPIESKNSNVDLLASVHTTNDDNKAAECEGPVAAPRTNCGVSSTTNGGTDKNSPQEILNNSEATNLMPPPAAPLTVDVDETLNKRPQRAAKLKTEKNLKEPKLNSKLRRPSNNEVKVKLEHEQRPSQMHEVSVNSTTSKTVNEGALKEKKLDESVCIIPGKQHSIVSINSDVDELPTVTSNEKETAKEQKKNVDSTDSVIRELRIKVKREKLSAEGDKNVPEPPNESVFKVPEALPQPMVLTKTETTNIEETSLTSSILSSTANATNVGQPKKLRKKKDVVHKPIKVERFSDIDRKVQPVSLRTRQGCKIDNEISLNKESTRNASIYEDAVEAPPPRNSKEVDKRSESNGVINETVNIEPSANATINLGPVPSDATFCANPAQTTFQVAPGQTFVMEPNPNATVTLDKNADIGAEVANATFDVQQVSKTVKNKEDAAVGQRSFETAKDSSTPHEDSLMTEDEQEKPIKTNPKSSSAPIKTEIETNKNLGLAKAATYKMATRAHELFNPLAQSPVKMRVEAFENAAAAAATEQPKRPIRSKKENFSTSITPTVAKLPPPALGRFLTPTQSSNITAVNSTLAKKGTTSASKALTMPKSANASSLYRSNSAASSKTLQRENSAEDFRKGLQNLAEERKKQREQKHLLAAQQREAKERERAERMAKLAKEREEKRLLKKQQEQEQKKRELEEIQRKLRQQQEEEAAKVKAVKERELLLQMKQQQLAKQKMMPPPPKITSKYTFEMLHEDDSTDDEDKVSYKRPPPPSWSRSQVRGPLVLKQEYTPSAYIDSFFSVQPMTPDLKVIFPNIDARHLKRNSSVLWSTPPRYSELPKY